MPPTGAPTELDKMRMHEMADLILDLEDPPGEAFCPPHNSASIGLAQDLILTMPKTQAKRCKTTKMDPMDLSCQLLMLALQCRKENRPGHGSELKKPKCKFEREAIVQRKRERYV